MPIKSSRSMAIALSLLAALALSWGTPAGAADAGAGYRASFLADFERSTQKIFDLAEAIPADKFGWRPVEGVRTVSEVLMHVAGANFFIPSGLGTAPPEGIGRDLEKTVTEKSAAIAKLRESIAHVRQAAEKEQDFDREIELFGRKMTARDAFMILAGHSHEHLGQLIAYARSAGVVPPWSQPAPMKAADSGE
ncbi:MAG: DinB family protein [Thermoanaerobaculia bacterium]|nr:DinB family protein [Thermoanaerobaculia bacterium]